MERGRIQSILHKKLFQSKHKESGKIKGKTWYSKHDIAYFTAVIDAKYKSKFEHAKVIPDPTLAGELWSVFGEDFGENRPRYNGNALNCGWAMPNWG